MSAAPASGSAMISAVTGGKSGREHGFHNEKVEPSAPQTPASQDDYEMQDDNLYHDGALSSGTRLSHAVQKNKERSKQDVDLV